MIVHTDDHARATLGAFQAASAAEGGAGTAVCAVVGGYSCCVSVYVRVILRGGGVIVGFRVGTLHYQFVGGQVGGHVFGGLVCEASNFNWGRVFEIHATISRTVVLWRASLHCVVLGGVVLEVVGEADEAEESGEEDEGVKSSQDNDTQVHPEVENLKYLRLSKRQDDDSDELCESNST